MAAIFRFVNTRSLKNLQGMEAVLAPAYWHILINVLQHVAVFKTEIHYIGQIRKKYIYSLIYQIAPYKSKPPLAPCTNVDQL